MDLKQKASEIFHSCAAKNEKITRLNELELDLINEMEAEDQNMHPEISHNLSEALRMTRDYLRELGV